MLGRPETCWRNEGNYAGVISRLDRAPDDEKLCHIIRKNYPRDGSLSNSMSFIICDVIREKGPTIQKIDFRIMRDFISF